MYDEISSIEQPRSSEAAISKEEITHMGEKQPTKLLSLNSRYEKEKKAQRYILCTSVFFIISFKSKPHALLLLSVDLLLLYCCFVVGRAHGRLQDTGGRRKGRGGHYFFFFWGVSFFFFAVSQERAMLHAEQ